MKMIVCVDFDGTIVEHCYPEIGPPMPLAFETLQALRNAGVRLILWTCREDDSHLSGRLLLSDAVEFCREHGVEFDAVNETIFGEDFRQEGSLRRKPYANYYIDDGIIGGFPGWAKIREFFDARPMSGVD